MRLQIGKQRRRGTDKNKIKIHESKRWKVPAGIPPIPRGSNIYIIQAPEEEN